MKDAAANSPKPRSGRKVSPAIGLPFAAAVALVGGRYQLDAGGLAGVDYLLIAAGIGVYYLGDHLGSALVRKGAWAFVLAGIALGFVAAA